MESPAPSSGGRASPSLTESPTIVERSPDASPPPQRPPEAGSTVLQPVVWRRHLQHPAGPVALHPAAAAHASAGSVLCLGVAGRGYGRIEDRQLPNAAAPLGPVARLRCLLSSPPAQDSGAAPWETLNLLHTPSRHLELRLLAGFRNRGPGLFFPLPGHRLPRVDAGVCDVSKHTCLALLGAGKSIMIAVGGGTESLFARPGANQLVLRKRKGFIKVALRSGASLVPVYVFGENSTFRTANEQVSGSLLHRFQRRLTKLTGFTVPLFYGTGLVLPWGFLPFPVPLEVVVGEPLEVERFSGDEGSAEFQALVDRLHARYVAALTELFDSNNEKFAKGEANLDLVE